jgi:hypothetical protein
MAGTGATAVIRIVGSTNWVSGARFVAGVMSAGGTYSQNLGVLAAVGGIPVVASDFGLRTIEALFIGEHQGGAGIVCIPEKSDLISTDGVVAAHWMVKIYSSAQTELLGTTDVVTLGNIQFYAIGNPAS